jgi:hypothetical protein
MPRDSDWGIQRPGCAAQIPDRSTGTVDVYAQHASKSLPAQSIRSHHPPSMRLGRPARLAGNCIFFSRHEFAPSSFLDPFTWSVRTRIVLWLVQSARFASGAWLAPFWTALGRAARPIGSPASARMHTRGPSCPSQRGSKLCTKRATCRRRRRGHLLRLPAVGPAQASLAT